MTNTALIILGAIVVAFIAFKLLKSIVKGIIVLVIIAIAIMLFNSMSDGKLSLETITSKLPTQVQQQRADEELNKIVEKLKGMDTEQIEAYLKNAQSELEKYGLSADSVKEALKKSNP